MDVRDQRKWEARARNLLKAELKRRGMTYADLVVLLEEKQGVRETEQNLRNKLSRGRFSAVFLLMTLDALGVKSVSLED